MDNVVEPYTVVLTSCGRFDLLERTLRSLLPRLEGPVVDFLLIEDSGDRNVIDVAKGVVGGPGIDVTVNDPPLGQFKSIDLIYSKVKTEFVFHCEDDWEFFGPGFMNSSFSVLKEKDCFSIARLRNRGEIDPLIYEPERLTADGVPYHLRLPGYKYEGYAFTPSLRRLSDYRRLAPFSELNVATREHHICQAFQRLGYVMPLLAEPAVRHIGDGRHVDDYARRGGRAKNLARSARKRLQWLGRRFSPDTDPVRRARREGREP